MKINQTVLSEIKLYVSTYYSNQFACLLSGSYAEGRNNEYSDIDIIVFTTDRITVFNETLSYKKFKFQIIVIPVQNIQENLWIDYISSIGAFIDMLSKGVIIFDQSDFLKNLILHTKELKAIGCKPLTDHEIYMSRVKITSLLFDIMGDRDLDQLLFAITELLELITEFKLKTNRIWCGKYKIKSLGELDRKFQSNLLESVKEIYGNKNKIPLINLTTNLLDQYGGILPYYSKANSLSKVSDDYLIIEINNVNQEKTKKTILFLNESIKQIQLQKINSYFLLSKSIAIDQVDQNVYLVIETDKNFINDYLIEHFNFLIKNRNEISKLSFPFQFDPVSRFSTKDIYFISSLLFQKLSDLIIEKPNSIFNVSFQIAFSLKLMKEIKKIWFKNNSNVFCAFNEYIMNCWFPVTYDDGSNFKTAELIKSKETTLMKFENMYHSQKKELIENYKSAVIMEKSLLHSLKSISKISDIDHIPAYKTYLTATNLKKINTKQWSLYRETLFTMFSVALIDNRFISYIPFIIKKIELND